MAHIAFVVAALFVALFFLWRKQLDPLAIALGSSLVYFVPGIPGIMQSPLGSSGRWYTEPIAVATYGAMGIVIVALALSAALVDLVPRGGTYAASFQSKVPGVLLAFVAVATAVSIQHTGVYFLCIEKSIAMQKVDQWYSYASISAPLCVATAYALRQRINCSHRVLFLAGRYLRRLQNGRGDFIIGNRDAFRRVPVWGMANGRAVFPGGAAVGNPGFQRQTFAPPREVRGGVILRNTSRTGPSCRDPIRAGRQDLQRRPGRPRCSSWATTWTSISTNPRPVTRNPGSIFRHSLRDPEPFVIQAMLNEVVRKDFRTDADYLVAQLLAGLPLGERLFGN